ncbi:MAG: type II toxin-antitoxin system VapC family toxin [Chloroflexi bacterium]|nr:type II toxin-antitoxin system VapC family toxin [Chloroflexota bacterium]
MTVVADANVFLAFALGDEPLCRRAQQLLLGWHRQREQVAVPLLFRAEITAVVRKVVFVGRVSHEQGRRHLAKLLAFPVTVYDDNDLLLDAYDLAEAYNRPRAYDTQ